MTIARRVTMASGGFSPLSVANLVGWWDATDATTLFTDLGTTLVSADAQSIEQWNDKSGNALHLTQTISGRRPVYKVSILNGHSIARFTSAAPTYIFKGSSGVTSADDYAQWVVMKPAATGTTNSYVLDPLDSTAQCIIYGFESSMAEAFDAPRVNVGTYDGSNFGIYEIVDDNSNRTGRLNGTQTEQVAAAAGHDVTTGMVTIGSATGDGGDSPFSGDIAELLYYSAAPTSGQVTSIRNYLSAKHGIAVS